MIPAVPAPGRNDAGRVRRIVEMIKKIYDREDNKPGFLFVGKEYICSPAGMGGAWVYIIRSHSEEIRLSECDYRGFLSALISDALGAQ